MHPATVDVMLVPIANVRKAVVIRVINGKKRGTAEMRHYGRVNAMVGFSGHTYFHDIDLPQRPLPPPCPEPPRRA